MNAEETRDEISDARVGIAHGEREMRAAVDELTKPEAWKLFDRQARRYLGISGNEFLAASDSGSVDQDPDKPEVMRVAMLLPLAQ